NLQGVRHRENPLLVVGSSHRGEEEILIGVYLSLKERFARLQMVLAPRHPQRFAEVEKLLKAKGLDYQKKSGTNGQLDFVQDILPLRVFLLQRSAEGASGP